MISIFSFTYRSYFPMKGIRIFILLPTGTMTRESHRSISLIVLNALQNASHEIKSQVECFAIAFLIGLPGVCCEYNFPMTSSRLVKSFFLFIWYCVVHIFILLSSLNLPKTKSWIPGTATYWKENDILSSELTIFSKYCSCIYKQLTIKNKI